MNNDYIGQVTAGVVGELHKELYYTSALFRTEVDTLMGLVSRIRNEKVRRAALGILPLWVDDLADHAQEFEQQHQEEVQRLEMGWSPDIEKLQGEFLRGFHDDKER